MMKEEESVNMPVPQYQNVALLHHPLMGREFIYHDDFPHYDPDNDREPRGLLVVAAGFPVRVRRVFLEWNRVENLDMLYVFVPATGEHTHVVPGDLGLGALVTGHSSPEGHDGQRQFITHRPGAEPGESVPWSVLDCAWYDVPLFDRPEWAQFDCTAPVGRTGSGHYSVLCEAHFKKEAQE